MTEAQPVCPALPAKRRRTARLPGLLVLVLLCALGGPGEGAPEPSAPGAVDMAAQIRRFGVDEDALRYFTDTPSYSSLPDWLRSTTASLASARRFASAEVDADAVERLTRATRVTTLGLTSRNADGSVGAAPEISLLRTFLLPAALADGSRRRKNEPRQ